jgi:hypothetical protein
MTNRELSKIMFDRGFSLYLRSESLKKLINDKYIQDKSFESYKKSKFYGLRPISYSDYLSEHLSSGIDYSEYICESVEKSIQYTNYISEQCSLITGSNISYSEYIAEKI